MTDTQVRPIPRLVDDDTQSDRSLPSDSAATRHLCAGVYVDRAFRDRVIRSIHNDTRHRIAPSYGFDLVPVVRHAWWSWLIDTGQRLVMLGGLLVSLAMGGVSAAVAVCCAIALCLLLRGIIWVVPHVLRLQVEAVSERWGRTLRDSRRRRVSTPDLRSRKRQLKAMLVGCLLVTIIPLLVSSVLAVPVDMVTRSVVASGAVLVAGAIAAGVARQLKLNGIARAQVVRPVTLTRREAVIDVQQNHPCVIYPRPPHQDDDEIDPLDLLTQTDGPSPFVGSGKLVNRWLPPLTVQLLRPGEGSLQEREYARPPFSAHALVETLRTALTQLGTDPGEENLPGLQVRDRIYIAAADFPAESGLVRPGLGKLEIWGFVDSHRRYGHHFLETSVPIFGGELVATVLIRVSLKGRCLSLDVATCALTRTPETYHAIDWYRARGTAMMLRSVARSVLAVPRDAVRMWRLLEVPVVLGRAWWALKDRSTVPRRRSIGPRLAVREKTADTWENAQLDRTTIYDHMKIVEQRILKATEDFLKEHGVDTSAFEKQATNIINSGVLNMGGGQMSIGQLAAGINAQIINNESEGASA